MKNDNIVELELLESYEVDTNTVNQVVGALPSSGIICTLSAECNSSGTSCWDWIAFED